MHCGKRLRFAAVILALVLGCTPPRTAGVVAAVVEAQGRADAAAPSVKAPPAAPSPSCVVAGDGEPEDRLLFHEEPELVIFGGRADQHPLLRIEGRGRYTLHGRWSELPEATGDGRARLALSRDGAFRVEGYAQLSATRFRLRRRSPVVDGHVWLEPDFVVRLLGMAGARARVTAPVPFEAPRELALEVGCEDLAYDDRRERVLDPHEREAEAHVDRLVLHAAPGGAVVFEAASHLFFVAVDEESGGFLRIHGERYGVRIAGWTPRALVSHEPQGSGGPSGSRRAHGSSSKGKPSRVLRATPLLAERAAVRATVGELAAGAVVRVLGVPTEGRVAVELASGEVRPVAGVTLQVEAADLAATDSR